MDNRRRIKARACDPFLSVEDINKVRKTLNSGRYGARDSLLFTVGINVGLRVGDLIRLKIGDFRNNEYIDIVEHKTKKRRIIKINDSIKQALNDYISGFVYISDEVYLFQSQKGGHLKREHVHKIIKRAARLNNINGNFGSHSMRKTTAYHALLNNQDNKDILISIMSMFNHTSESTTLRYLTSSAVVDDLYDSLKL